MRKNLLLFLIFAVTYVFGQRSCRAMEKMEEYLSKNPDKREYVEKLSNRMATRLPANKLSRTTSVVTIPVVVHVLYKNSTQNISYDQIKSQIEVLNNDYRKLNSDFSTAVPAYFQNFASDMELVFCLATKDVNGNPTNGVVRKSVAASLDLYNDYSTSSGDLAWDPTKYLNIWVGDFLDPDDLGYATLPYYGDVGGPNDGVVISYKCFGTMGTAKSPYNLGRTTTHEVGHYFGLFHTWGKSKTSSDVCGSVTNTDECNDTPQTYQAYLGKPKYPDNTNMCTKTANGAMFMNFMDYVDDDTMAMFTNDQKTVVRNILSSMRASLINSNVCTMSVDEVVKTDKITIYPNPAASQYISVASPDIPVDEIEVYDATGRLIISKKNLNAGEKIDIRKLSAGVYYTRLYSKGNAIKSEKFIKE